MHVVWIDGRTKNADGSTISGADAVYYSKRSVSGTGSTPEIISLPDAGMPYIGVAVNNTVLVGYYNFSSGSFNITQKQGFNAWSPPVALTSNWIFYCDFAFDGFEITYLICSFPGGVEYYVFNGQNWTTSEAIPLEANAGFLFPRLALSSSDELQVILIKDDPRESLLLSKNTFWMVKSCPAKYGQCSSTWHECIEYFNIVYGFFN